MSSLLKNAVEDRWHLHPESWDMPAVQLALGFRQQTTSGTNGIHCGDQISGETKTRRRENPGIHWGVPFRPSPI